jgi:hypothetical protein
MKIGVFVFLFLLLNSVKAQYINGVKVDTSNYYNFISDGEGLKGDNFGMGWLRLADELPIIKQEMKSAGYDSIHTNYPIEIAKGHFLKVTVYSTELKAGFLYIEGHSLFPSKEYRKDMTQKQYINAAYGFFEKQPGGKENYYKVEKLPKNVLPLNENNYWFQFTENPSDNSKLVTKQMAISFLRQDIRAYLAKWKAIKSK